MDYHQRLMLTIIVLEVLALFVILDAAVIIEKRMIRAATTIPALKNRNRALSSPVVQIQTTIDCKYGGNCTSTLPPLASQDNETLGNGNETFLQWFLDQYNPNLLCLDYKGPFPVSLKRYNPDTQICCNGLYNRTKPREECCNGNLIDNDEEICCNNQHFPINRTAGCCGNRLYDKNDTLCCNGTLAPKTKYSVCCGNRVISEITEICCDGRAHVKDINTKACCGGLVYNPRQQVCCKGIVRPKLGPNGNHEQCCGKASYDPRCFICSDDLDVQPKDNMTFNGTCCEGKIIVNAGERRCCTNGTNDKGCRLIYVDGVYVGIKKSPSGKYVKTFLAIGGCFIIGSLVGITVIFACKKRNSKSKHHEDESLLLSMSAENFSSRANEHPNSPNVEKKSLGSSIGSSRIDVSLNIEQRFDAFISYIGDDSVGSVIHIPNHQEVKKILDAVSKPSHRKYTVNEIEDHFKDIACQTVIKENAYNRRNIFGRPFTQSCLLDNKQPIFRMEHSEVSVQLPISALTSPIEMHGSSFDNIPAILENIYIPDSEVISSPVVEYLLTGDLILDNYAVVTMPYLDTGEKITVWKFMSDGGMHTRVEPFEVPMKGKDNANLPFFYQIEGNKVKIYTKSFSGFFVTTRKHKRGQYLNLRAFLFGSHKRLKGQHEARLVLYIADEIMNFEDYKKPMYDKEASEGRHIIKEQILHLTNQVREVDVLRATVIMDQGEAQTWKHQLHPKTRQPVYPVTAEIRFQEIVQKCPDCEGCHFRHKTVPYCVEWYLRTSEGGQAYPNDVFKCYVDVNCVQLDTKESKNNTIIVDELHLRPEDRYPSMESDGLIGRVQRFLIRLDAASQAKFVEKMKEMYHCTGSEISHIFEDLQRKMKPVGVCEAVVHVLQAGHMYEYIDALHKTGILEERFFPKPTPRVCTDDNEYRLLPSPNEDTQRPFAFGLNTIAAEDHTGLNTIAAEDLTVDVNVHVTRAYSRSNTSSIHHQNKEFEKPSEDIDPRHCRNELASDLPACSFDRDPSFNRNALSGCHERPDESIIELTSSTYIKQTGPIQEEAPEEETSLKLARDTDSDSECEH